MAGWELVQGAAAVVDAVLVVQLVVLVPVGLGLVATGAFEQAAVPVALDQ